MPYVLTNQKLDMSLSEHPADLAAPGQKSDED